MTTRQFEANEPIQTRTNIVAVKLDTPGAVTLEYSADGSVWTQWTETIADANVVISNVPNGLYLKFTSAGQVTD